MTVSEAFDVGLVCIEETDFIDDAGNPNGFWDYDIDDPAAWEIYRNDDTCFRLVRI